MKDRSLIAFTILSQLAVGAFWTLGALYLWSARHDGPAVARALTAPGWPAISAVSLAGLLASLFHLGTPAQAWRAFGNLGRSWLSREIFFAGLFAGTSTTYAAAQWLESGPFAVMNMIALLTGLIGLALIYVMSNAYRLRTIPAWNTPLTPASFFVTTLLLGPPAVSTIILGGPGVPAGWARVMVPALALWIVVLLGVQLGLGVMWLARLRGSEAAARSAARVTREQRATLKLRVAFAVMGMAAAVVMLIPGCEGCVPPPGLSLPIAFSLVLASEVLGRALFYAARMRYGV